MQPFRLLEVLALQLLSVQLGHRLTLRAVCTLKVSLTRRPKFACWLQPAPARSCLPFAASGHFSARGWHIDPWATRRA